MAMSSMIYEFRVDGRLPEHAQDAFCGLDVEETPPGVIVRGAVIDESHLLGIISEFRLLGLSLVSVRPVTPGPPPVTGRSARRSLVARRDAVPVGASGTASRRAARRLVRRTDRLRGQGE